VDTDADVDVDVDAMRRCSQSRESGDGNCFLVAASSSITADCREGIGHGTTGYPASSTSMCIHIHPAGHQQLSLTGK